MTTRSSLTHAVRRLALGLIIGLVITLAASGAYADPAGRSYSIWIDPGGTYLDRPGAADWGWPACTCNPVDYRGDFCATDRDPGCGGSPANQGGIWEWSDPPGYWEPHTYPNATVAGNVTCTPGANGWCRSAATLTLTGSEPVAGYSITSIQGDNGSTPFSLPGASGTLAIGDTPSRTITYRAYSSFGDSSYPGTSSVKVDTQAPATNLNVTGPAGASGWYTGPVQIALSSSDATSGLASLTLNGAPYTGPRTFSAQGLTLLSFFGVDQAGNAETAQAASFRIDSAPPTVSASLSGPAGANGWYSGQVTVALSGADATSGLAGLTLDGAPYGGPRTYNAQGTTTVTFAGQDVGGNVSGSQTRTFSIDSLPPAVTVNVTGLTGTGGWYIGPVTVELNGVDAASGVAALALDGSAYAGPRTYNAQGATTVTAGGQDVAGNRSADQSRVFQIDSVPPSLAVDVSGPPGANGWFIGPVAVALSGADLTSGLKALTLDSAPYSTPRTYSADGVATITCAAEDQAGNVQTETRVLPIDTMPPSVSVTLDGPAGQSGWFVGPVAVELSGADAASGIQALTLDGAPYSGPWLVSAEGVTGFDFSATDRAGHSTPGQTASVKIDSVAPTSSIQLEGQPGDQGWFTSPVTVTLAGTDATSGLADLTLDGAPYSGPRVYSAQAESQITYSAADVAGNAEASHTHSVRIDTVAPSASLAVTGSAGQNGWYVSPVTLTVSGADATSGLASLELDGALYSAPIEYSVEGASTVSVRARDHAGNLSIPERTALAIDLTPPTTQATLVGLPGLGGWFIRPVLVSLTAEDAASGVDRILLDGTPYTGPRLYAGGTRTITVQAVDRAGNAEAQRTIAFNVDQTPPSTTLAVEGSDLQDGWYHRPVTVKLSAADGDGGSGVARTVLNDQPYTGPWAITTEGEHRLTFFSVDRAGNSETPHTQVIRLDTTAPAVALHSSQLPDGQIQIEAAVHDALSGARGGVVAVMRDWRIVRHWNFDGEAAVILWDGLDENGQRLSAGSFFLWASGRDRAGNETTSTGSEPAPLHSTPSPSPTPTARSATPVPPAHTPAPTEPAPATGTAGPTAAATATPAPSLTPALSPTATRTPLSPVGQPVLPRRASNGPVSPIMGLALTLALALATGYTVLANLSDPRPPVLTQITWLAQAELRRRETAGRQP